MSICFGFKITIFQATDSSNLYFVAGITINNNNDCYGWVLNILSVNNYLKSVFKQLSIFRNSFINNSRI